MKKISYAPADETNAAFTYLSSFDLYNRDDLPTCSIYGTEFVSLEALACALKNTDQEIGFTYCSDRVTIELHRNQSYQGGYPQFSEQPEEGYFAT